MRPALPDPRKVWRSGKAAAFAGPRTWKYCFKLDLATILACACDKWGVFAEMWVTSNRQDRNIFVGRVKGMLLENFHKSWQRSHQWLFSSWNKCDSQQRDDGLNNIIDKVAWQLYVPRAYICTVKELRWWFFWKKQAQSERLPPTQAALCQAILRVHYQIRKSHPSIPRKLWLDGGWKWMGACHDETTYTTPTPDTTGYVPCKVQMRQGEMFNKTLPM